MPARSIRVLCGMAHERFPRGIMASCVIPWDEQYQFIEDMFREEVHGVMDGADLGYIFGTAGEGYAVSEEQFNSIVRAFTEEMRRVGADPMVGVISPSLPTVLSRIERSKDMGVRQFQISLPSWGTCTRAEAADFFDMVCGAHRDCLFLHYNIMRAGRLIEPEEYAEIAERNTNLIATKNSSRSVTFVKQLFSHAGVLRHFITDPGYAYASFVGDCGLLIATASCNWTSARAYYNAGVERAYETALEMQGELIELVESLKHLYGPGDRIDGAYDKLYVKLHQPEFPLRLLPPYHGADDELFERFAKMLRTEYPRWYPR